MCPNDKIYLAFLFPFFLFLPTNKKVIDILQNCNERELVLYFSREGLNASV